MAVIYSQVPCKAAGVFTSNIVKAAPVVWDKNVVEHSPYAQAVVINAGIANACTGAAGYDCCKKTAECAAETLDIPADAVLVASTGVIGMQIPVEKITAGIEDLARIKSEGREAAGMAACPSCPYILSPPPFRLPQILSLRSRRRRFFSLLFLLLSLLTG